MKNKLKKIVNLHRYVGLGICIFVVHLAITGIFLNHSIGLRLDRTFVAWPWLLNQYNLTVPEPENIFTIGKNNFSRFSDEVFFNDNSIFSIENDLVGVIENKNNFILASNSVLNVVSNEGFLLTREDILPFTIKKIGSYEEGIFIQDHEGKIWSAESIDDVWKLAQNNQVEWSSGGTMTAINKEKIRKYYVGDGISLEQIILDFHSGAIFQKMGKIFFDIISILLIILSFSGIWLWTIKRKY